MLTSNSPNVVASPNLRAVDGTPGVPRRRDGGLETAAEHVVTRVPTAAEHERIADVVARLAGHAYECVETVCVLDDERGFRGGIRLPDLLNAHGAKSVRDLMDPTFPRVGKQSDQEHVAAEALAARASSVAVVDEGGRFLGLVPSLSLLDILRREHVEDLHRLAGIQRETEQTREALETPPVRRARHRLPWLIAGLAGSMVAATVVSRFEHLLQGRLAVAFFVPAIVYLADAIGTQTEAIVVRGLSLSRLSLRHLLLDELRTGGLIGLVLGTLAFPIVALNYGDLRLAAAVALAILIAGAVATTIGLVLPWLLQRSGSDPAFGSGPIATIVQDVLSLVIYFAVASALLQV